MRPNWTFIDSDYGSNMTVHLAWFFFVLFLHIDILSGFNLEFSKHACVQDCQSWSSPPTFYFPANDRTRTSKNVIPQRVDCLFKPPVDLATRSFALPPDLTLNVPRCAVEALASHLSQETAKSLLKRSETARVDPLASQDLQNSTLHIGGGLSAGIIQTAAGTPIGSLALLPDGISNDSPLSLEPSLEDALDGPPDL